MMRYWRWSLGLGFLFSIAGAACGSSSTPAGSSDGGGVVGDGGVVADGGGVADGGWITGDGGVITVSDGGIIITPDGGTPWVCRVTACAGRVTACGDCLDNDGDGLVDWKDPECLGPCDNTESPGLAAGIGGQAGNTCKVDCYFDFGNGPGNDQCKWDHRCDPLEPEGSLCPYTASMVGGRDCPATQDPLCESFCLPYTPNGCDCFGCCTFPQLAGSGPDGGVGYVFIGALDANNNSTCTFDTISDPAKCPACTPVPNCLNECGPCEVCLGRPEPPPSCFPDGGVSPDGGAPTDGGMPSDGGVPDGGTPDAGTPDAGPPPTQCPDGIQPCGLPGQADCQEFYYCITGCCRPG